MVQTLKCSVQGAQGSVPGWGSFTCCAVWPKKKSKHFLLEFSSFNVIFNDCLIVHLLTCILIIPFYVIFVLIIFFFFGNPK